MKNSLIADYADYVHHEGKKEHEEINHEWTRIYTVNCFKAMFYEHLKNSNKTLSEASFNRV
jgi:hypothetical protein